MMNLLPQNGEIFFYPSFFDSEESEMFFSELLKEISWKHEPIKIFGKEVLQPRLTAWYGDKEYSYSGIKMSPHPWNDTLWRIKSRIEEAAGAHFNSVLINQYRDQKDSMGWHKDDEKELGINPIIASVSFGASRKFCLKHCQHKELKLSLELTDGSLLIMRGQTQHYWLHSVPKTARPLGPRINLTFRMIL